MKTAPSCGFARCRVHRYTPEFQQRLMSHIFVPFLEKQFTLDEMAHLMSLYSRVVENGR